MMRHASRFYDRNWHPQPFVREAFPSGLQVEPPRNLSQMISVAENLANDLDFVRVDLYSVAGRLVFGEMTLASGAGWIPFRRAAYDRTTGSALV